MNLLAIETSGAPGSIALRLSDGQVVERQLQTTGRRHAQTLIADVEELLRDQRLRPGDVQVVAVSIGPGSFTGLRVGLVFARIFAWINHASLVAVDTLQAIAQQAPPSWPLVTSVVDAQRGEVFAADYRWNSETGLRESVSSVRIATPEQLPPDIPLCGPALTKLGPGLSGERILAPPDCWLPSAGTIARLGEALHARGVDSAAANPEPVYIRRSYAEEARDLRAAGTSH